MTHRPGKVFARVKKNKKTSKPLTLKYPSPRGGGHKLEKCVYLFQLYPNKITLGAHAGWLDDPFPQQFRSANPMKSAMRRWFELGGKLWPHIHNALGGLLLSEGGIRYDSTTFSFFFLLNGWTSSASTRISQAELPERDKDVVPEGFFIIAGRARGLRIIQLDSQKAKKKKNSKTTLRKSSQRIDCPERQR